mmetsp:Transcript_9213/g.25774  ORF Transcript_9213/g.25774 Transcript_9213/m.25774 type:complete len:273 (+) Transcript_9213:187-1005(+)
MFQNLRGCDGAVTALCAIDGHCMQALCLDLVDHHLQPAREEAAACHVPLHGFREAVVHTDVGAAATAVEDARVEVGLALRWRLLPEGLAPRQDDELSVALHVQSLGTGQEVEAGGLRGLLLASLREARLLRALRGGPGHEVLTEARHVLQLQVQPVRQVFRLDAVHGDCERLRDIHGDARCQVREETIGVALKASAQQGGANLPCECRVYGHADLGRPWAGLLSRHLASGTIPIAKLPEQLLYCHVAVVHTDLTRRPKFRYGVSNAVCASIR